MGSKIYFLEDDLNEATTIAIEQFLTNRNYFTINDLTTFRFDSLDYEKFEWIIIFSEKISQEVITRLFDELNLIDTKATRFLLIGDKLNEGTLRSISPLIKITLEDLNKWNSIVGLILCGGKSTRMNGRNKALLKYHNDLEQYKSICNLLKPYLDKIIVSINENMVEYMDEEITYVVDKYNDIGPMSGLASVLEEYGSQNYFVLGCDYPYITELEVFALLSVHNTYDDVTCFHNGQSIDPMLAIYSASCSDSIINAINLNQYSLKKLISKHKFKAITPEVAMNIISVDEEKDYFTIINKNNQI